MIVVIKYVIEKVLPTYSFFLFKKKATTSRKKVLRQLYKT